ncbi:MAG: histidinol-phosphatase [Bacteroidales bacterium]|nr:histidinol-phosphatase [Bacteroidales bacterium]
MKVNYHTHSRYCDGKGELRDYVEYALAHGFTHLGFSGHAPVPFANTFSIHDDEYDDYCREVRQLQQEFADRLTIRLGLEIDYIPGLIEDFQPLVQQGGLDYVIGSVHIVANPEMPVDDPNALWFIDGSRYETYDEGLMRLFGGDIKKGVTTFFRQTNEMIERNRPTIVGHFDKIVMHNRDRYFHYDEPWFLSLVGETVELIREVGSIAEINTRGIYKGRHYDYYPAKRTIQAMNEKRIPVVVSTDAHEPSNLDLFEGAYEFLESIHYREVLYTF